MAYALSESHQSDKHPTGKNRVWRFSRNSNRTRPGNRPRSPQPRQENRPATTRTASGVRYYGYRYYDPVTGRWPSRDPIWENGGENLYAFVENDGIDYIDFMGEKKIGGDGKGTSNGKKRNRYQSPPGSKADRRKRSERLKKKLKEVETAEDKVKALADFLEELATNSVVVGNTYAIAVAGGQLQCDTKYINAVSDGSQKSACPACCLVVILERFRPSLGDSIFGLSFTTLFKNVSCDDQIDFFNEHGVVGRVLPATDTEHETYYDY